MAKRQTWFGTRGHETWIPTPAINPDYSRSGHASRADYLNGGAGVRESKNAHNIYVLSWQPTKSRDAIRVITDFADGVFDSVDGINLINWIDPMAKDKNVLAQAIATPSLQCEDAPPIITDVNGYGTPKAVPTPANTWRYPPRGAQFTQRINSTLYEQYLPIPPGYSAWVGVHGDTSNRIIVQRVNGYTDVGATVAPTLLGVTSTLVNTEFSSVDSSGIVIKVNPVVTKTIWSLYALIVQILPIGQVPVAGEWISGQGHSGCQFVGKPSKTPYSAKLDRVGATARLEETGLYL